MTRFSQFKHHNSMERDHYCSVWWEHGPKLQSSVSVEHKTWLLPLTKAVCNERLWSYESVVMQLKGGKVHVPAGGPISVFLFLNLFHLSSSENCFVHFFFLLNVIGYFKLFLKKPSWYLALFFSVYHQQLITYIS